MPNPTEIKSFWIKWIDRQYAKADPSHVKMRAENSERKKDTGTVNEPPAEMPLRGRVDESPPGIGFWRR
jgi:hypothetical protein